MLPAPGLIVADSVFARAVQHGPTARVAAFLIATAQGQVQAAQAAANHW